LKQNALPYRRAFSVGINFDKIRDIALDLYAHRDLIHTLQTADFPNDLEAVFSTLVSQVMQLRKFSQDHCKNVNDEGFQSIDTLSTYFDSLQSLPTQTKERALTILPPFKPKGNQKNWSQPERCKEQKSKSEEIGKILKELQHQLRTSVFSDLVSWLNGFVSHVEQEKKILGKLDFDDLLFLTRDLLKNHEEARSYFQKKYRYLLVDEFQDTDPIQTEIIWWLCAKQDQKSSWNELDLEPGKLFLVGDPKQSIYRFRRASIETYWLATQLTEKQGSHLSIQQNFRSNSRLVDWINCVFSIILGEFYRPLIADPHHLYSSNHKSVILLESTDPLGEESSQEVRKIEARSISIFIQELLNNQNWKVFDRSQKLLRPVVPQDIAILFPTTTGIDFFEEALRKNQIPFQLEGSRLFYQRTEIHGLLVTLEAILAPTDEVAVVAALRSMFFGCSDLDLLAHRNKGRSYDYRHMDIEDLNEPIAHAFRVLKDLHKRHLELLPSQIIQELIHKTFAIPIALAGFQGEQIASNLDKVLAITYEAQRHGLSTLSSFLKWLRKRASEEDKQSESIPRDGGIDRVRLLTVHKAKGLEFPVVILANLSVKGEQHNPVIADRLKQTLVIGIGDKDARFSTPHFEEELLEEKRWFSEEKKRLLYVAVTRARDYLILPHFMGMRQNSESFWKILNQGFESGRPLVETISLSPSQFESTSAKGLKNDSEKKAASQYNLTQRKNAVINLLSTRANTFVPGFAIETATSIKAQNFENAFSTSGSGSRGKEIGLTLHKVLEKMDCLDKDRASLICKRICLENDTLDLVEDVEKLAIQTLEAPIFQRILQAPKVAREVPFSFSGEGILYEGVIDLVLEEKDGLVVIDYKTDDISVENLEKRAAFYRDQVLLYKKALEIITRKPVKEALLFFVRLGKTYSISSIS